MASCTTATQVVGVPRVVAQDRGQQSGMAEGERQTERKHWVRVTDGIPHPDQAKCTGHLPVRHAERVLKTTHRQHIGDRFRRVRIGPGMQRRHGRGGGVKCGCVFERFQLLITGPDTEAGRERAVIAGERGEGPIAQIRTRSQQPGSVGQTLAVSHTVVATVVDDPAVGPALDHGTSTQGSDPGRALGPPAHRMPPRCHEDAALGSSTTTGSRSTNVTRCPSRPSASATARPAGPAPRTTTESVRIPPVSPRTGRPALPIGGYSATLVA